MSNRGFISQEKTDNAIKLSESEVVHLRRDRVFQWPNLSEIWSLKYGFELLALSNVFTNMAINTHFRNRFFLTNQSNILGLLSSHAMSSLIPPIASASLASAYFSSYLYRATVDECMTCREIKTLLMHTAVGSLIPTGISWTVSFLHADMFKTYGVPKADMLFRSNISRLSYMKQAKIIWNKTTHNSMKLFAVCYSIQFVFCAFIMFMQQKQFVNTALGWNFTQNEIDRVKNG